MTTHIATVSAFPNKFGTFTGAIRNEVSKEVIRERFETYDEARNFVKVKAWDMFGKVSFAAIPRKGEYFANVWAS